MREKLARFMVGRNGVDDLARFESWFVLVVLILSIFTRSGLLDLIAIALIVHMYFRVFSRNVSKRYEENQKFLNFRYDWTVKWNRKKKHFEKRPWQNMYHMSKMQRRVYKTKLVVGEHVWIYNCK